MLEYAWGNPSAIMLTGEDPNQPEPDDPNRQIFDHYSNQPHAFQDNQTNQNPNLLPHPNPTLFHAPPQPPPHLTGLFDARGYAASYNASPHPSLLSLDHITAAAATANASYFLVPKSEEVSRQADFSARIGLNLGGRTYFSSAEDDFVSRLYRRSRTGLDSGLSSNSAPRCQAEGCNADLTHAKHYHRRHKVCEFHSKASTVIAAGLTQRFCQQCSRFHLLSEFDNGKRSCRKRLADHNRRRRKSHQINHEDNPNKLHYSENAPQPSLPRSPADSGAQSSSSVTVAVAPPRMSLDSFKQRGFQTAAAASSSSSASSSSLFFLSG